MVPWPGGSRVLRNSWDPRCLTPAVPPLPAFPVAAGPYFLRAGSSCSGTFIQQLSRAEMGEPQGLRSVPGQISKLAETYDLFLSSREAAMGSGFSDLR